MPLSRWKNWQMISTKTIYEWIFFEVQKSCVKHKAVHWLSVPQEDSKPLHPLRLGIAVGKENNAVKHWMEQHLTHTRKSQGKVGSNSEFVP